MPEKLSYSILFPALDVEQAVKAATELCINSGPWIGAPESFLLLDYAKGSEQRGSFIDFPAVPAGLTRETIIFFYSSLRDGNHRNGVSIERDASCTLLTLFVAIDEVFEARLLLIEEWLTTVFKAALEFGQCVGSVASETAQELRTADLDECIKQVLHNSNSWLWVLLPSGREVEMPADLEAVPGSTELVLLRNRVAIEYQANLHR